MEPTSQAPQQNPAPAPVPTPPPTVVTKKSKKPFVITLILLSLLVIAGCAGWFWWSLQQPVDNGVDQPAKTSQQQKLPEPNTLAYSYSADSQTPKDIFWRSADGGERQSASTKAFVSRAITSGNQVALATYAATDQAAETILHSNDGGKSYKTIFTGRAPANDTDFGDQITGIVFASDGKSVIFGLLPKPGINSNTVKQVFFDKPNEAVDITTIESSGVFPIAFNTKAKQLVYAKGCYNCGGDFSRSAYAYDLTTKKETTLVDGTDKHLGMLANKAGTKLLITTPTIDKTKKDSQDDLLGYYVGAPYKFTIFDLATGKTQDPGTTVGTASDNKFVRGGFMADDATPYYYSGNQLFVLDKATPTLLYEAGQPIHEVFYVSPTTVFASTGNYQNFTLNRFGVKTQETRQLLTGDDTTTRIFGVTVQ